jgi:hypothetical protein
MLLWSSRRAKILFNEYSCRVEIAANSDTEDSMTPDICSRARRVSAED